MDIRIMEEHDIDAALSLWRQVPGMGLGGADEPKRLKLFLERNPGMSFVLVKDGEIAGSALCGTDMRRGYLYHVAVRDDLRGNGYGVALTERCLDALRKIGVDKCTLLVFKDNAVGNGFWEGGGWTRRDDVNAYSRLL